MIILKNHFNNKDTAIYGDIVSNGCQTFHISQLNEICEKFEVPARIKRAVIKHHQENVGVDDISANILDRLKSEENKTLNHAVAFATENQDLLEEMVSYFKKDARMRLIITNRKKLTKNLMKVLAGDEYDEVRFWLAKNPDLNLKTIKQLAKDKDYQIRCAIAERLNLDNKLIKQLANDCNPDVRSSIALRSDLDSELIEQMSKDEDEYVRQCIAKNPNLSNELINKLAEDKYFRVREAIAERPDLGNEVAQKLAKDVEYFVRRAIANRLTCLS